MEINELRTKIDSLDKEIVKLLTERMGVSAQVAAYKIANGMPVLDKTREAALLEKIASLSGDMSEYTHEIYLEILKQSRAYQEKLMEKKRSEI
ncbi:MAG: chorismate mutase [Clostridia bacterium]|nr:chorismate mutase [Clostridia bacterium]